MDTVNTELIRGHVDTIILNSLLERDRYGYEILDMISELSEGRYEIKQPTLYSCLKRLEKQGFITSYFGDESQGGRRRYYCLTEKGKATLEQDQREWEFSRTIINRLLSDKEIDLRTVEAPFNPSELRPLTRRVKVYEDEESIQEEEDKATTLVDENGEEENKEAIAAATADAAVEIGDNAQTETQYNREELIRIRQQQTAASKRLGIGEFAERRMLINEDGEEAIESVEPRPRPAFTDASYGYDDNDTTSFFNNRTSEAQDERLNYRAALGAIFTGKKEMVEDDTGADKREKNELDNQGRARHFGDLKQSLYEEGFNLKPYNKANSTNYYYMKFLYSNKILRDTSILTYLVLVIEVLIMALALDAFAINVSVCIAIGCVGLIIPIAPIIMWALNPTKRIKAQFNFGSAIIYAVVAFIVITGISLIIALVLPSQNVDFTKGGVYIPLMISALIPIAVLIYGLLYRSGNYHLKK